ncbi:MAG: twin-arginine translocation signal domain-containing protein [Pseudomonadota bacterium]
MPKKTEDRSESSRRDFLKLAVTAAPAAAVAAATGGKAEAAVEAPSSLGMQKTEHVRKYLDSARF